MYLFLRLSRSVHNYSNYYYVWAVRPWSTKILMPIDVEVIIRRFGKGTVCHSTVTPILSAVSETSMASRGEAENV